MEPASFVAGAGLVYDYQLVLPPTKSGGPASTGPIFRPWADSVPVFALSKGAPSNQVSRG